MARESPVSPTAEKAAAASSPERVTHSQAGHEYLTEEAIMADDTRDPNDEPTWAAELIKAFQFGSTYPGFAPVSAEQGATTTGAGGATSQLQQTVTQALRGVLGRTFKQGDSRSFQAALEVSFVYKEVSGRQTYEWRPRAYPTSGAADIGGGISGAQFSLVSFANSLYEKTLPLIDQVYSLIPDVDEEEMDAARAIYRSVWSEFIGELGREGGPRAPRANELSTGIFNRLDQRSAKGHLVRLGGLLGMIDVDEDGRTRLRKGRLNIKRRRVVTTEEESNLTSFISLTDYFFAVDQSWDNYRVNFFQKDLGTGLLTLERQLAVLAESVNEVFIAMDSVFVDQAERLAILIDFKNYKDVSVEDFLSWIVTFATTEAPGLIREGGKWGVEAILPTAERLNELVGQFVERIKGTEEEEEENGGATGATGVTGVPAPSPNVRQTKRQALLKAKQGPVAPYDVDDDDDQDEDEDEGAQRLRPLPPAFNHPRVLNPLGEVSFYLEQLVVTAEKISQ
jgi:hypothetical protein